MADRTGKIKVSAALASVMSEYVFDDEPEIEEIWAEVHEQISAQMYDNDGAAVLVVDAAAAYELASWADSELDFATSDMISDYGALLAGARAAMMRGLKRRAEKVLAEIKAGR